MSVQDRAQIVELRPQNKTTAVVYFIRQGHDGPIKIGHTTRPLQERLGDLQIGNPEILRVVGVRRGGRELELELHTRFARYHIRGEWFEPADELIHVINNAGPGIYFRQRRAAPVRRGRAALEMEAAMRRVRGDG